MARLYADEDFDHPIVHELRRLGHDILTVGEAGRANRGVPDIDVLSDATALGWSVITFNRRDFIRLHRQSIGHAGIIVRSRDVDVSAIAHRIDQAIAAIPDLAGPLIRVNRP
jgi:hypothetical protein